MIESLHLSPHDWVHLPANSGLRLRADDSRFDQVGPMALPFLVIESSTGFQPVWGETELRWPSSGAGRKIEGGTAHGAPVHSLEQAVAIYRKARPLPAKVSAKPRRQIDRVVTLDLWLPEGRIAHRYADATALVHELARENLAANTLLYITGWSGPYDARYPQYVPVPELGGEEDFGALVHACREHGTILMPHLNFWGYDISSGLIPDYEQFQVRNAEGKLEEWAGVMTAGFTNRLAYMRVDDPRWTQIFFQYVDPLISRWELEALFLDQIGLAYTPGIKEGSIALLQRLHATRPGLIIGGELLVEFLIPYVDVMQSWGPPWCGLMTDFSDSFSPISRLLYGPALTFMGHLGLPCAHPCRYAWTNYPYLVEKGYQVAFEEAQTFLRKLGSPPHVRLSGGLDPLSLSVLRGKIPA